MSDMFSFKTVIDLKPLESYSKEVTAKLPGIVKKNAFEIQAKTRTSQNMPVDTGNMRDSINPLPTDDQLTWEIGDFNNSGAQEYNGYAIYQELGTGRGIAAHHFLGGACEDQADKFFDEVKDALK